MIRRITDLVRVPRRDFIYDFVAQLPLALCVDVGAAAGEITRRLRLAGGTATRVVAFEPFPGNFPYFEAATCDLDQIELVRKAVADACGHADLFVGSSVSGSESRWERFAGYSSVGFLPATGAALIRQVARDLLAPLRRRPRAGRIRVETTTLDACFPVEHLDFVKIDVQGAERRVLAGAENLLREGRVGAIYLEWSGDAAVERTLERHGFLLYDSTYVGQAPEGDNADAFRELGFEIVGALDLSTGARAFELVYRGAHRDLGAVLRGLNARRGTWIQTDLVALPAPTAERFRALLESQGADRPTGT
jgi:FkbM family methyltransferase